LSAEELTQALNEVRPFRRLEGIDLKSYEFGSVFVDPPRAGMDPDTCELTRRFDASCTSRATRKPWREHRPVAGHPPHRALCVV
jgi:hypothetical protein